jgi:hypothetical protein
MKRIILLSAFVYFYGIGLIAWATYKPYKKAASLTDYCFVKWESLNYGWL